MKTPSLVLAFVLFVTGIPNNDSFVAKPDIQRSHQCALSLSQQKNEASYETNISRRQILKSAFVGSISVIAVASAVIGPAFADVYSGTSLPQGVQQFARVVRLKSELVKVRKRLTESASEIDEAEFDNISKFLRTIYSVADSDMKYMSKGIKDTDNKNRALAAIEQLKRYAQAGDVSASKKDAASLASILEKCSGLTAEFLDALYDVPSEI